MPIYYDSKKIIPAPFVSIEKNYSRVGYSNKVGSTFRLTIKGAVVCGGSPNSRGEFYTGSGYPPASFQDSVELLTSVDQRQKFLQAKIQAIRNLFSKDGLAFEIQPWDGSTPMRCYPHVYSVNIEDGVWVDKINYTVILETDEIFGINNAYMKGEEDFNNDQDFFKDADGNKLYLSEVDENWQLETLDSEPENLSNPYTFRLTHNVSAIGKRAYDDNGLISAGWEQAKKWVVPRLGIDNSLVNNTDAMKLSGMAGFNHVRQENTDEFSGSYSVTETWLLAKGNSREDFTITTQNSIETGLTSVNIDGEVIGLDTRDSNMNVTESKWTAALAKFNVLIAGNPNTIFTRAQDYSGITLNSTALGSTIGKNPISGRITYGYQYDNRPTNCIAGSLSEQIIVSDKNPTDVFASIAVIGRTSGPVLQDMNTTTERRRSVSIDINMPPVSICPTTPTGVANMMNASPAIQVEVIVNAFEQDLLNNYSQVFKDEDSPTWNAKSGRYSRVVGWTFQNCNG
jgi:hypothetical protein